MPKLTLSTSSATTSTVIGTTPLNLNLLPCSDSFQTGPKTRDCIVNACNKHAKNIVLALRPKRLVVIGLETFSYLGPRIVATAVQNSKCRILVRKGELWGTSAFGVLHLSGARISNDDIDLIKEYFGEIIATGN